jgi:hypothetical protein
MYGYLVLVDESRYVAQAKTAREAEERVRSALSLAAQRIHAARQLSDDEVVVFQLTLGEVRPYPAEHG